VTSRRQEGEAQRLHTFWRHLRGWPRVGQIGFAIVIGVVVAAAISTAAARGGSARTSASSVPTTTSAATAVTTSTAKRTTSSLVPLTIASSSHQDTYNRAADFGGFVAVDGCKNSRAILLIRTSRVPVTFTSSAECTVKTGRWTDPWSGTTTTVAHDLQVDHTVPLANAWRSGAWAWTHEQRIAYANDLADTDHLVAILSSENEAKGDDGPDQWKPPNPAAWCRYATAWDRIDAKWHLSVTPAEWNAIVTMAATCKA
jgi:hypothetical protein